MRQAFRVGLLAAATGVLSLPAAAAFADSGADGVAKDSPGVLSGNTIQVPVEVPVNVCGNTVDVVGIANPAVGNTCVNDSKPAPEKPKPKPAPPVHHEAPPPAPEPKAPPVLAQTGGDSALTTTAAAAGAALLIGGGILYRRGSAASRPAA
ncbi:chaplin [Streptomyces sp. NA04227]|uniref:chaplin n=1 Tax=Streptomyces sp. NA04227 TaxID=2742136 RepID=UPI0020CA50EC|nr:chaplin [Streptomyces sp. NA04227]